MPKIKIILHSCLWCEKEMPVKSAFDSKLLCSMKCLNELKKAIEKQHVKGCCGYDKSDVLIKKEG